MSKAFGVVGLVFLGTMLLYSCLASPEDWTPPERNITPVPTFTWQQRRAQAVEISYDDLLQNAEEHFRKTVFFRGTVIQVVPQRGDTHVWVDVAQDGKARMTFYSFAHTIHRFLFLKVTLLHSLDG